MHIESFPSVRLLQLHEKMIVTWTGVVLEGKGYGLDFGCENYRNIRNDTKIFAYATKIGSCCI